MIDYSEANTEFKTIELASIMQLAEIETERLGLGTCLFVKL
jgi:hypothetical protein